MDLEKLSIKVEVLEKTLAVFQRDFEDKMKLIEKLLSSRNEQFSAQKRFAEQEDVIYQMLLSNWKTTMVELQNIQRDPRFAISPSSSSRAAHSPKESSAQNQQDGMNNDNDNGLVSISIRSLPKLTRMSPYSNTEQRTSPLAQSNRQLPDVDKTEVILCDPLGNSVAECAEINTGENSNQELKTNAEQEYDRPNSSFFTDKDNSKSNKTDNFGVDDNESEDDTFEGEDEEVQVVDVKYAVPLNQLHEIENAEIMDCGRRDDQPNMEMLLPSGVTMTANKGPTITNVYSNAKSNERNSIIEVSSGTQERNQPMPNLEMLFPSRKHSVPSSHYSHGTSPNIYSLLKNKYKQRRSTNYSILPSMQQRPNQNLHSDWQLLQQYQLKNQRRSLESGQAQQSSSSHSARNNSFPNSLASTICADCGRHFGKASALRRHREEEVCSKCFECAVCDPAMEQYFNDRHGIVLHMLVVHKLRKFRVCQFCRKCFGPFRGLLEHQLQHHPELSKEQTAKFKHQCMLCPKTYSTRNDLSCHVRSLHTGERPFICNVCKRTFADSRNLRKHINVCGQKNGNTSGGEVPFNNTCSISPIIFS